MGEFRVEIKEEVEKDLKRYFKSGDKKSIKRIERILMELKEHPTKGIGKPEPLKYELSNYWSRRINKKDRMIYTIEETEVLVTIVSVMGHYLDK